MVKPPDDLNFILVTTVHVNCKQEYMCLIIVQLPPYMYVCMYIGKHMHSTLAKIEKSGEVPLNAWIATCVVVCTNHVVAHRHTHTLATLKGFE